MGERSQLQHMKLQDVTISKKEIRQKTVRALTLSRVLVYMEWMASKRSVTAKGTRYVVRENVWNWPLNRTYSSGVEELSFQEVFVTLSSSCHMTDTQTSDR
jgi:hypothetical protein